jgi:hypothetical protein
MPTRDLSFERPEEIEKLFPNQHERILKLRTKINRDKE